MRSFHGHYLQNKRVSTSTLQLIESKIILKGINMHFYRFLKKTPENKNLLGWYVKTIVRCFSFDTSKVEVQETEDFWNCLKNWMEFSNLSFDFAWSLISVFSGLNKMYSVPKKWEWTDGSEAPGNIEWGRSKSTRHVTFRFIKISSDNWNALIFLRVRLKYWLKPATVV